MLKLIVPDYTGLCSSDFPLSRTQLRLPQYSAHDDSRPVTDMQHEFMLVVTSKSETSLMANMAADSALHHCLQVGMRGCLSVISAELAMLFWFWLSQSHFMLLGEGCILEVIVSLHS